MSAAANFSPKARKGEPSSSSTSKPAALPSDAAAAEDAPSKDDIATLKAEIAVLKYHLKASQQEVLDLRKRLEANKAAAASSSSEAPSLTDISAWPPEPDDKDKRRLIKHLLHETYVSLGASAVAGVGVFAIRDIPEGVDPFPIVNTHLALKEQFCTISAHELRDLAPEVMDQVKSFFAPLTKEDEWTPQTDAKGNILYGVLCTGLNSLNCSWYLNHAPDPKDRNIKFKEAENDGEFNSYMTTRIIRKGEELLTDYRALGREYLALVTDEPLP
mmetsp:Transcript_6030/g.13993  ORF Transcript_6030/g.13993 Transcript_6030/m.13993 type:complete len:273 (-) Transcript_6030:15-833(-)|eukprot:CAMPEP_0194769564 /NCGR_PEP_ID=MMETSP0323_2-20130528/43546_1 /TAXON_ID=2866 ORGANISM="Crypthecodinium cohnii, Strain Seligo" /NCGR_SAMPLE_ID=MMETSP0323_2 /ASSEMBLY_ACC=CAM_ASM_000346 /LENGTH=272 /DNA_ID=CAMNT_0039702623 /DNA_START=29 /DNA_END=847 /DNA_ORIENTATION=+